MCHRRWAAALILEMALAGMVYVKVLASTTAIVEVPLYSGWLAPLMVTDSPVKKP